MLNLVLKRFANASRPYVGHGEIGHGYGMPSSHSQAAGFLLAWGAGYYLTLEQKRDSTRVTPSSNGSTKTDVRVESVRRIRSGVYLFGLGLWSVLVAYSRYVP